MNRKLHRWLAGTLAAPFLYVCVTGTATTLSEIADPASVRRSTPPVSQADMPPLPPDLGHIVHSVVTDALRRHPQARPGVIEVDMRRTSKGLRLQVWADGLPRTLVYDGDGRLLAKPATGQTARPAKLSATLQDLHSGLAFGRAVQGFVFVAGLALAVMTITGLFMYAEMLTKLRAAGRKALFWK
ncbi:PepSY-associated TM helix domain-containing protein [Novosphingobium resinovorum]|uniref:PepSY-associated TM helix domain-containing protein n=1 Tax=Novosphingobium resinovorum TaxID=158500 RepID=UPI002ED31AAE|nr:PepSY-associated TM helix domain-containing protein [Novosphingobium resinovorum]